MAGMARSDAKSPRAGVIARHSVSRVDRRAPVDANALACCLFVREWLRYAYELPETIATLEALDRVPVGDCDDMVVALAALLHRLGYGWHKQRFGIGYKGRHPAHVWLECRPMDASLPDEWIPLDPSTWRIEPGESPATIGGFSGVEYYNLRGLLR